MNEPSSILVFRNGSIGNTLAATPAIRALKERFPQAPITAVLDSAGAELLRHSGEISNIIRYDKRGADRSLISQLKLIRRLRSYSPSHAVLFKRFFRNGLLARLSGAPNRVGYNTNGSAPFLNQTIPYDESIHIVDLNLKLVELLGAKSANRNYELTLTDQDRSEAEQALAASTGMRGKYAAIHYGGSTSSPDYFDIERFAELLKRLLAFGVFPALIGSGDGERNSGQRIQKLIHASCLMFNRPLRVMASVIENAVLFVGFNSGPAHIAAAVGTPGVVFYRPDAGVQAEINKWRPVADNLHPMIPPASTEPASWNEFLSMAGSVIENLLQTTLPGRNQ